MDADATFKGGDAREGNAMGKLWERTKSVDMQVDRVRLGSKVRGKFCCWYGKVVLIQKA
jgi:hypothetical protein